MLAQLTFPDISPELFSLELFGMTFALRWYALAYIGAFVLGWRMVVMQMNRPQLWAGQPPMAARQVEDLLVWMVVGVILGGRLGFVLFYQPAYYLSHPTEILMVWQGGMSFHGGFLGVIAGVIGYALRNGMPVISVGDAVAVATPPGLFLGRIANFINAELWGKPTSQPWGMVFPGQAAQTCPPDWIGACTRHPSQLYEAGLEGLLLFAVMVWLVWVRGWLKVPGRMIGVFLLGYGAARFFVEFFREPDAQFITEGNPAGHIIWWGPWGFSMGQGLSLPMIVIGATILIVLWRRRPQA